MDFNSLPLETQIQLILNDLCSCHILGADSLKFGSVIKALEQVIQENRSIIDNLSNELKETAEDVK